MKISIIIPNYNGGRLLEKNIPFVIDAAKEYEGKNEADINIIIVDDKSEDNSISVIQKIQERRNKNDIAVTLLQNKKNLGFSPTVNRGVQASNADIVVLLNTDVRPDKDFLIPLLAHFTEDRVFAVGAMDKSVEGEKIVLRGRGIGKWNRGFLIHKAGTVEKSNTLWVSGGSGAFRRETWIALGGLCEVFKPFYWEDIDLSYRAKKTGYQVLFENKSIVYHYHDIGAIKSHYSPSQVKKVAYRNQFFFVWINITDSMLLLNHIAWLPIHMVSAITRMDFAFIKGFFAALFSLSKVIHYRFTYMKKFTQTDTIVLRDLTTEFNNES